MEDSSFDPQGTQWYAVDPNGSSAEPPASPDRKKKKRMRLLVGAGIAIAILLFGGILARSLFADRAAQTELRQEKSSTAEAACEKERDPEKCKEAAPADLAREEGDPAYCEDAAEGASRDSCLALAAMSALETSICEEISDAEKKDVCHDAVVVEQLKKEGETIDGCAEYRSEEKKQSCLGNVFWAQALSGDCSTGISEERCDEARITSEAIAARDPDRCQAIRDESRENACRDRVGPGDVDGDGINADDERNYGTSDTSTDSDGDGLSDGEEVTVHKTDPAKADTDGDGYSDSTEISGGYDPLH